LEQPIICHVIIVQRDLNMYMTTSLRLPMGAVKGQGGQYTQLSDVRSGQIKHQIRWTTYTEVNNKD